MSAGAGLRAAVLGTGSWGTAFAAVLADAGCDVALWGRTTATCEEITLKHRNERYLPGVDLPPALRASTDASAVLEGADLVAIAIPSQSVRATLEPLRAAFPAGAVAVSLMKGVELATDRRMSQVVAEALALPDDRVAVVSGPNLAREIAEHQPTATVVASTSPETAALVARACASAYFRPYTNDDVVGVELCGAVKNVIALAVGISQGRGLGYNTMATVITRGLVEITRLGLALGAQPATFPGLAGMGDLMATCASPDSRNHKLGVHLGQGMTLNEALTATGGTAEGVKSSRSVLELAHSVGVEMPITSAVVQVLHEGLPVEDLAPLLLGRPHKAERV
ncbi:NAD(P)H-dependent glycerol-3-phosphate dehydrogenase [Cellulomonas chengniuliangii]|uniref:Glycerol-3-phosphate dehydrogenase [NAD(P)+] n=1 Tax=Cellulomonas chengniuliangii TaxID=2968084 RepID=A0ABY5L4F5_9CELL|nr:NAD(P)H-dependent glycerol-3-phosphate dehydrogenase [Cellulomonas chengniuliangii]MCC2309903.1 NAD(P)-dependent glycerol-3-phosphate dehydrogenase [Cellulomonas chengniuliangii]MCC2318162.1 NAD(P)-dependent glycerol-3-phosphate dehydrogenase [Cellulomonas chengniuliangii]UUI76345.1 NAD(P)-dependent glycerol-3-phosphate dehydrogenase [Cellulomonas chengniuliangii]